MRGRPAEHEKMPRLRTDWPRRPYYVEDGLVRPVMGSKIESYDPFGQGYYAVRDRLDGRPLYVELWDLDLDLHEEDVLRAFASKWGLLGLFFHDLLSAEYLAAYPKPGTGLEVLPTGARPDAFLEVFETPSLRTCQPRGWSGKVSATGVERFVASNVEEGRALLDGRRGLGTVWKLHPPDGFVKRVPLVDYYARYFPAGRFPSLHSAQLWDLLCEPVDEIRSAVESFRGTYWLCAQQHAGKLSEQDQLELEGSFRINLHGVRQTTLPPRAPGSAGDGERWQQAWHFPSLLSAAYMMLRHDFTMPRRYLRLCRRADCGRPVVTDRSDRVYCNKTCMNTDKTRRLRHPEAFEGGDPR